jgi:hypothetical protein
MVESRPDPAISAARIVGGKGETAIGCVADVIQNLRESVEEKISVTIHSKRSGVRLDSNVNYKLGGDPLLAITRLDKVSA